MQVNPNYPDNELSKIYPKMTKPVIIENDDKLEHVQ